MSITSLNASGLGCSVYTPTSVKGSAGTSRYLLESLWHYMCVWVNNIPAQSHADDVISPASCHFLQGSVYRTEDGSGYIVHIGARGWLYPAGHCNTMALSPQMKQGLLLCRNHWTRLHSPALCPVLYSGTYRRPGLPPDQTPFWEKTDFSLRNGVTSLKKHLGLAVKEAVDHLRGPNGKSLREDLLEQTNVVWEFRRPEDLKNWVVSSDVEIGGKSQAYLKLGNNEQTGLFYGVLNNELPRDGETKYSGYCTLRTKPPK
ncbi:hypothetical protein GDO81_019926, partial [Engystomops pustulosus]